MKKRQMSQKKEIKKVESGLNFISHKADTGKNELAIRGKKGKLRPDRANKSCPHESIPISVKISS